MTTPARRQPRPFRLPTLERAPRSGLGGSGAAIALLLAATIVWGFSGVIIKGVFASGVGALEIAFWRLLLGGSLFALHAGSRGDLKLAPRTDAGRIALFALVAFALHYASYNVAIERGGVSLANLFLASVPVLVALGARLFLGERLTSWKAALGVLSAAGLTLVAGGGGRGVDANLVSVGAGIVALATAVGYCILGKDLLRRYAPTTLNAFAMPVAALGLFPFVDFAPKTPSAWFLIGILSVVSTYAAHLFYQLGLKRIEASRAALLINVEAVTALATAAVLFGERFTPQGLLGVALILVVSALASLPRPPTLRRFGRGAGAAGGRGPRSGGPAAANALRSASSAVAGGAAPDPAKRLGLTGR